MGINADKYNKRGVKASYVSTVIGISLVLFLIGLVIGGILGLSNVQKKAKESLQGDLFFKSEIQETDIKQIEQELKTWNEFSDVFFVSPDRAKEEFAGTGQASTEILSIFDGENPLPPTVGFKPTESFATKDGMNQIKQKLLSQYPQIDEVNYDQSSVESVNLGFKQFAFLVLAVASLLIVIAVAMINNTIRMALYAKRFTIKTMQLVGAKSSFIRKPFLYQAILQGLVSALIGIALLLTLFYALNNVLTSFEISFTLEIFFILLGSMFSLGIIITFISTWFALNKYLRMKLDDLY